MSNMEIMSKLRLELDSDEINYKKSSDLQGILFEHMNPLYAEKMHFQQLHPYSQYVTFENGKCIWYICATSEEAYENIIKPLEHEEFDSFIVRHGNLEVKILDKQISIFQYSKLMENFYNMPCERKMNIELISLASFKQRGRYNVTPDLRLIFQSLMMKYSAISANESMIDSDTLEQLEANSHIIKYSLRTGLFPLEGQKIPGFRGRMTIRFDGTETMARYARMLLQFGEYAGIGVKTGMGMGAIKIYKEGEHA